MVYLDNAATTRVSDGAARMAAEVMRERYGNPSSSHKLGREAKAILEHSRETIASALNADAGEIYFTSGGTEGDNLAIIGGALGNRRRGGHIISSEAEHEAVFKALEYLKTQGFEITLVSPETDGSVSADSVLSALRPDTCLVTLMAVNNETGAVTDIEGIAALVKKANPGTLFHTDAVQAFMHRKLDARKSGVDLMSVSGHKIHAPKGVGAVFAKKGLRLSPIIHGGGQENGLRSGTEALPLIASFAEAAGEGLRTMDADVLRMSELRDQAITELKANIPTIKIIGGDGQSGLYAQAPHILCLSLPGYKSEVLMNFLESREIYVSKGSACKRGKQSRVLKAIKLPNAVIDGAVRVSLSRYTTREEMNVFRDTLCEAYASVLPVIGRR